MADDRGSYRRIVISTLADLKRDGWSIIASCERSVICRHSAKLDLDGLISRFGPQFEYVAGRARILGSLRCSKCGGKNIALQFTQPPRAFTVRY